MRCIRLISRFMTSTIELRSQAKCVSKDLVELEPVFAKTQLRHCCVSYNKEIIISRRGTRKKSSQVAAKKLCWSRKVNRQRSKAPRVRKTRKPSQSINKVSLHERHSLVFSHKCHDQLKFPKACKNVGIEISSTDPRTASNDIIHEYDLNQPNQAPWKLFFVINYSIFFHTKTLSFAIRRRKEVDSRVCLWLIAVQYNSAVVLAEN